MVSTNLGVLSATAFQAFSGAAQSANVQGTQGLDWITPSIISQDAQDNVLATLGHTNSAKKIQVSNPDVPGQTATLFIKTPADKPGIDAKKFVCAEHIYYELGRKLFDNAPESWVVESDGKFSFSSAEVEGQTLNDYYQSASPSEKKQLLDKIAPTFGLAVVIRGEDTAGLNFENQIVTPEGKPYEIDRGLVGPFNANGSVFKRMEGKDGTLIVDPWTQEIAGKDLNDPTIRKQYLPCLDSMRLLQQPFGRDNAALLFSQTSFSDFRSQIEELHSQWPSITADLDAKFSDSPSLSETWNEFKPVLGARLEALFSWLNSKDGTISQEVEAELTQKWDQTTNTVNAWIEGNGVAKDASGQALPAYTQNLQAQIKDPNAVVAFQPGADHSQLTSARGTPFLGGVRDVQDNLSNEGLAGNQEMPKLAEFKAQAGLAYAPEEVEAVTYEVAPVEDGKVYLVQRTENAPLSFMSFETKVVSPEEKAQLKAEKKRASTYDDVNMKPAVNWNSANQNKWLSCRVTDVIGLDAQTQDNKLTERRFVKTRRLNGDPGQLGAKNATVARTVAVPVELLSSMAKSGKSNTVSVDGVSIPVSPDVLRMADQINDKPANSLLNLVRNFC